MANVPAIGSIDANLPLISDAADYIRNVHNALVTEHDNLQQFLQKLKADWNSNASISYNDAQNNWDNSADAVYEVLRNLYVALGNIHDNYLMTDGALAKQWSA
ncbi:WXG100 family type VII secretion target [Actinoallomurus rhizosphaericola]|uniref:WXG100 family type VII secretion target n=1 Tax=Actinoallomurus rhizosphaericola TaxID=2952536 RepID=UPI002093202B|nr:WXG100 family type VII secretion target [Actinoallomurus rhizosphaericola]MCO5995339.1 WXG100 family type VII secretion target [Actinoallomurus rhizosphaericola]